VAKPGFKFCRGGHLRSKKDRDAKSIPRKKIRIHEIEKA
jgi:hypothetical protein